MLTEYYKIIKKTKEGLSNARRQIGFKYTVADTKYRTKSGTFSMQREYEFHVICLISAIAGQARNRQTSRISR
jgi:hypothetical protein